MRDALRGIGARVWPVTVAALAVTGCRNEGAASGDGGADVAGREARGDGPSGGAGGSAGGGGRGGSGGGAGGSGGGAGAGGGGADAAAGSRATTDAAGRDAPPACPPQPPRGPAPTYTPLPCAIGETTLSCSYPGMATGCTETFRCLCVSAQPGVQCTWTSQGQTCADAGAGRAPDASFVMCGAELCGPTQACVHECTCGGAAPRCETAPDGGVCPAGTAPCSTETVRRGCVLTCMNPPPRCRDVPVSCAGVVASRERVVSCNCPP